MRFVSVSIVLLYVIMEYLIEKHFLSIHSVNKNLRRIVEDERLWETFDFTQQRLTTREIIKRLYYVNERTKHFRICGYTDVYPLQKWRNMTLTENMLEQLRDKAPHLESLVVLNGYLDLDKVIHFFTGFMQLNS